MSYATRGTCARQIDVEVRDGIVTSVRFHGGCPGNLQGVARLVEGMPAEDVIARLRGIRCGFKPTSCPDQLTYAIEQAMNE
ncbi:MAG: TIGR03905 family TSCPD domain-containing protein [Oscillospiraceae bacterium]|nr:TIGR03905 family TSCPD domain-containing protein [Oscillospiraceae bacterium]